MEEKMKTNTRKLVAAVMAIILSLAVGVAAFAYEQVVITLNTDGDTKTITVDNTDRSTYEYEIVPSTGVHQSYTEQMKIEYSALTAGVTYTVKAYAIEDGGKEGGIVASSASVKLKNAQSAPTAPTAYSIASDKIKVTFQSGVVIQAVKKNEALDENGWLSFDNKNNDLTIEGLEPDTLYYVYARYPETDEKYASVAVNCTTRTLKLPISDEVPTEPIFYYDGSTSTQLAVIQEEGYEYSIDGGSTWQRVTYSKNEETYCYFTGLTKDTDYDIIKRLYTDETYESSPASDPLSVKTLYRDPIKSNKYDNTVTFSPTGTKEDKIRVGSEVTITAKTVCEADSESRYVHGDTKIIPSYVIFGSSTEKHYFTDSDTTGYKEVTFTPDADGDITFKIVYEVQKYSEIAVKGQNWLSDDTIEASVVKTVYEKRLFILTAFEWLWNKIDSAFEWIATLNPYFKAAFYWLTDFLANIGS